MPDQSTKDKRETALNRPSILERNSIKPYSKNIDMTKNSDIHTAKKIDYSNPVKVKEAFDSAMLK